MKLKIEIGKAFDKAAPLYEKTAKVQHEIGERLLSRLDFIKIAPRYVLDLGCGNGSLSEKLRKRYPKAIVISLDLSMAMLQQAKKRQGWFRKQPLLCADMHQLPFADGRFDLVFANQILHWSEDMSILLREITRVMNTNACLMLSTMGPDTLREISETYAGLDNFAHVNRFQDMHDIGDQMLRENLLDPVVDMEYLTLRYSSVHEMLHSLKAQGVRNIHNDRNKGLSSKQRQQLFGEHYHRNYFDGQKYPLTYEVIYAHGWRSAQRQYGNGHETVIPISAIKR